MATLETTVNGLKLPNPFVIGSGPPHERKCYLQGARRRLGRGNLQNREP